MTKPTSPSKSHYHHPDLHRALIEAALDTLAEQVQPNLSMRDLARRIGVSHTAPYRHFTDLTELELFVAAEGNIKLSHAMTEALTGSEWAALPRFQRLGIGYLRFALNNPALYRLVFDRSYAFSAHPALKDAFLMPIRMVKEIVRTSDETNIPLIYAAWSLAHGLVRLRMDGFFLPEQRTEAAMIQIMLQLRNVTPAPLAGKTLTP